MNKNGNLQVVRSCVRKWRYAPGTNETGLPDELWRVKDIANFLGVGVQNIYTHIHEGTLNPLAYTKFGKILVFFPWRCIQLLEDGELYVKNAYL